MAKELKKSSATKKAPPKPKPTYKDVLNERQIYEFENPYKCIRCGTRFVTQKGNFYKSQTDYYEGNDNYIPVCNDCLEELYRFYVNKYASEKDAIKRVCMMFGIYFSDDIFEASKTGNRSRVKEYMRVCNHIRNRFMTYDNYLESIRNDEGLVASEDMGVDKPEDLSELFEKWGQGYTTDEYQELEKHYEYLKSQLMDDGDPVQLILIRDLCNIHILKRKNMLNGDFDKYEKSCKLYQSTLSSANLKPTTKDNTVDENNPNNTWGCFNRLIENYTPSEYYKDKSIFADHDKIGEYIKRHMLRPMKNWFTGSKDKDEEYSLQDCEE